MDQQDTDAQADAEALNSLIQRGFVEVVSVSESDIRVCLARRFLEKIPDQQ